MLKRDLVIWPTGLVHIYQTKKELVIKRMMTSSNGNIFRVTGPCAWNSPVPVTSPQRPVTRMFSLICVWINNWVNNREAGDLRHRRGHYNVIVMVCVNQYLILVYFGDSDLILPVAIKPLCTNAICHFQRDIGCWAIKRINNETILSCMKFPLQSS